MKNYWIGFLIGVVISLVLRSRFSLLTNPGPMASLALGFFTPIAVGLLFTVLTDE